MREAYEHLIKLRNGYKPETNLFKDEKAQTVSDKHLNRFKTRANSILRPYLVHNCTSKRNKTMRS